MIKKKKNPLSAGFVVCESNRIDPFFLNLSLNHICSSSRKPHRPKRNRRKTRLCCWPNSSSPSVKIAAVTPEPQLVINSFENQITGIQRTLPQICVWASERPLSPRKLLNGRLRPVMVVPPFRPFSSSAASPLKHLHCVHSKIWLVLVVTLAATFLPKG